MAKQPLIFSIIRSADGLMSCGCYERPEDNTGAPIGEVIEEMAAMFPKIGLTPVAFLLAYDDPEDAKALGDQLLAAFGGEVPA